MRMVRTQLRQKITCPHCWHVFSPEETVWISSHPELLDDPRLGDDQQLRFLPSRFNVAGNAIDSKGMVCQELACPNCHLPLPRPVLELIPFFVSIVGTPSCGKSYFLASMTWRLRKILPANFAMTFGDADTVTNKILNDYEEQQFFNPNQDALVRLAKTEEQGDLYSTVLFDQQRVSFPRPFLFAIKPTEKHPRADQAQNVSQLLSLYDNAGESFLPGKDTVVNPVTRHLAVSKAILFCLDPTQDPRFRKMVEPHTKDYQVIDSPVTTRQETVFHEMALRVRKHSDVGHNQKTDRLLVVVVTKFDVWKPIFAHQNLRDPIRVTKQGELKALDLPYVEEISKSLRELLWKTTPELVAAAEGLSERVLYVPVSATGGSPEKDPKSGVLGIRPKDINPIWCEVPMLLALIHSGRGTIPFVRVDQRPGPSK